MAECPNPLPAGDPYFKAGVKPACAALPGFDPDNPTTGDPYYTNLPAGVATYAVRVEVLDSETAAGVSDFAVSVIDDAGDPVLHGITDGNGQVNGSIPAGNYTIQAFNETRGLFSEAVVVVVDENVQVFTFEVIPEGFEAFPAQSITIVNNGVNGIYDMWIDTGDDLGEFIFRCDATADLNKFEVFSRGVLVANSMFIGNSGGITPVRDQLVALNNLNYYKINTDKIPVLLGNVAVNFDYSDIASIVLTRAGGSHDDQIGVVENYPTPGTVAVAGDIQLRWIKQAGDPRYVRLRVTAADPTDLWIIYGIITP